MTEAALDARTNLLGLTRPELEAFVASLGSKPFRAVYGTDDELLALANRLIGVGIA